MRINLLNKVLLVLFWCLLIAVGFQYAKTLIFSEASAKQTLENVDDSLKIFEEEAKKVEGVDSTATGTPIVLASKIIVWFMVFSSVLAVAFIIYGGYQYIISAGNQDAVKKAIDTITKAVIGLVIILAAWLVITLVLGLLTQDEDLTALPEPNNTEITNGP